LYAIVFCSSASTCAQAPLLALVAFGGYLLLLLINGALSFRSCPEDAKALQQVSGVINAG
jgi:hypothetical protein